MMDRFYREEPPYIVPPLSQIGAHGIDFETIPGDPVIRLFPAERTA